METQYFSKNWLPSLSLVLPLFLTFSLSETSCSLGSCFDNADPQTQGVAWVYVCVFMMGGWGWGGLLIQEPSTCKSAERHARPFHSEALGCWNWARLALNTSVRCRKPCAFYGAWPFVGAPSVQWLPSCVCRVFPGVTSPAELLSFTTFSLDVFKPILGWIPWWIPLWGWNVSVYPITDFSRYHQSASDSLSDSQTIQWTPITSKPGSLFYLNLTISFFLVPDPKQHSLYSFLLYVFALVKLSGVLDKLMAFSLGFISHIWLQT